MEVGVDCMVCEGEQEGQKGQGEGWDGCWGWGEVQGELGEEEDGGDWEDDIADSVKFGHSAIHVFIVAGPEHCHKHPNLPHQQSPSRPQSFLYSSLLSKLQHGKLGNSMQSS